MGKQKKKKTGGKKPQLPMVALYGLDAGTPRGDIVRAVVKEQGVLIRSLNAESLNDPVGYIAGITGFHASHTPFEGEAPTCEFMLIINMGSKQVDNLLAAMREADCVVGCKAQVTAFNRLWPLHTLIEEVSKEHAAMTGESAAEG